MASFDSCNECVLQGAFCNGCLRSIYRKGGSNFVSLWCKGLVQPFGAFDWIEMLTFFMGVTVPP